MKIYVVGNSKNKFLPLDNIREKFLIDQPHEGDNIDFLNPWYCELTGMYYMWKHVDDDIVGLEHYRRYFVNNRKQLLSEYEIRNILKTHDIICCLYNDNKSVFQGYKGHQFGTFEFFSLVKELPNYELGRNYLCGFNFIVFNMFICKKELINEYCEWFFKNIAMLTLKPEYKRYIGYYNRWGTLG